MSIDTRLQKLHPALTAKERARLVLQALKEGREEDWRISATIPDGQIDAYNRYLRLIGLVNTDFATLLIVLQEQLVQVEIKEAWLATLMLFGDELEHVRVYLRRDTKKAPDKDAKVISSAAADRERLRTLLRRLIPGDEWPIDLSEQLDVPDHEEFARSLAIGLVTGIACQLSAHWADLQAIETVTAEISDELGEDVFEPESRAMADDLADRMRALGEKLKRYARDYALPESDDAAVALMRRFVQRAERDS